VSRFVFWDTPPELVEKAAPLRANLAAIQMQWALIKLARKYSPSQLRVPAGNRDGGQWTGAGGVRLAGGVEDDEPSRRSGIVDDPISELRQEDFNNSVQTLRRLEPSNAKLPYVSDGSAPKPDVVNAYRDEVEAAKQRVAAKISNGHALRDHQDDFDHPSQAQLNAIVSGVLDNPSRVEDLPRGRTIFYDRPSNTVVFLNPADRDGGTAFRPEKGERYVDIVKERQ
jgi:hypothetical protein